MANRLFELLASTNGEWTDQRAPFLEPRFEVELANRLCQHNSPLDRPFDSFHGDIVLQWIILRLSSGVNVLETGGTYQGHPPRRQTSYSQEPPRPSSFC